jgi:dipeptidyl aminopeptidase/acylaminoacyl peptidase
MNGRRLALLLLSVSPTVRLSAQQRPWRATDYYKLTFVADPRLSPDGRRVAFTVTTVVEDKDRRHSEIWMAAADGSAPAYRYTSPSTEASSPAWSPDGSLLAFSSRREGHDDDIWFLRTGAPGGEAFQIKGVHGTPLFSRDGQWLLYAWRGAEPDSAKQEPWRTRVSPTAITRGPDPKRFDGRVYTSIPTVADERGFLPPRETRRPSHLYLVPLTGTRAGGGGGRGAASRASSRAASSVRAIRRGRPTGERSPLSRTPRSRSRCATTCTRSSTC